MSLHKKDPLEAWVNLNDTRARKAQSIYLLSAGYAEGLESESR
jgi:hypothetical protein